MTDKTEQHAGDEPEETQKLGLVLKFFYWFLLWRAGGLNRDKRRTKGKRSPSRGICGPINHDENGDPWLYLEIMPVRGYPLMSIDQQERVKASFDAAIKSFSGWRGGGELDLQVQAVPYDLRAVNDSLVDGLVNPDKASEKVKERHAKSRRRSLEYIADRNFKERRAFIGVKLSDERSFVERVLSQLMQWMRFSSLDAIGLEHEIYHDQIQEVVAKFEDNQIDVRELTGIETARVIQRCVYRGHSVLPELADTTGVVRTSSDLQRLTDSRARDHGDMIEIIQDGGTSYSTYLALAKAPEEFSFSWLYLGVRDKPDQGRIPVEVSARLRVLPVEKSRSEVGTTLLVIENALEHLFKSKGNKQPEINRRRTQKNLGLVVQHRLNEEQPLVDVNAFLIVSSDNKARLKRATRSVIAQCRKKGFILEVDEAYQAEIRRQCYPGSRLSYDSYQQSLFSDGVAQSMPHATELIGNGGDLHGEVLGPATGPYFYSHRKVLRKGVDTKTGQVFIGPSGEGKTDAMVNRAISDAEANMAAIFDEGKGDTQILEEELDLLVDIKVLNLSDPRLAGLLNPTVLGDDPKESRDLTLSVLMKCTGYANQPEWEPHVAEAVDEEFAEFPKSPDIQRIVKQRLRNAPETDPEYRVKQAIGRSIMGLMNARHADVIFAPGKPWQEVALEYIRRGQVTFVVYGELTPPDAEKPVKDLSNQERLALMARDLTNVVYYKIAMDPAFPLAIYKDEIQIDKRMGGSISSEHLSRIGRSKGSTINLGGQYLGDVPEGFWENTSTMNFFRFTTEDSAKWAIKLLRIGVKEGSVEETRLINLLLDKPNNGRRKYDVIVRTHDGEVGLVAFKQIYHGGRFVSNIEGVEERRLADSTALAAKLPFVRRAVTPEDAEAKLIRLGFPAEMIRNPNGHQKIVEDLKRVLMDLRDDQLFGEVNGRLMVVTEDMDSSIPQLPMSSAGEEVRQ
jgi:hypothetical protein